MPVQFVVAQFEKLLAILHWDVWAVSPLSPVEVWFLDSPLQSFWVCLAEKYFVSLQLMELPPAFQGLAWEVPPPLLWEDMVYCSLHHSRDFHFHFGCRGRILRNGKAFPKSRKVKSEAICARPKPFKNANNPLGYLHLKRSVALSFFAGFVPCFCERISRSNLNKCTNTILIHCFNHINKTNRVRYLLR